MSVEVRQVDEHVYDGSTGNEVDTVTRYELGAEIEGAWVKFASVSADHVAQLAERAKAQQKASGQGQQEQTGDQGAVSLAPNAAPHEQGQ